MAHWTQTPEGKKKLSEAIKAGFAKKRKSKAMKKMWAAKKRAKKPELMKHMTVKFSGPDAYLAMSELLSYHYKITITVTEE